MSSQRGADDKAWPPFSTLLGAKHHLPVLQCDRDVGSGPIVAPHDLHGEGILELPFDLSAQRTSAIDPD